MEFHKSIGRRPAHVCSIRGTRRSLLQPRVQDNWKEDAMAGLRPIGATVAMSLIIAWIAFVAPANAYEKEIETLSKVLGDQITQSGKKTIAVVDFTDLQGAVTELGRFLAEELSISLSNSAKGYKVIDRAHLKIILQEHKLATSDIIDQKTAKQLGRISGVDGLITGTITAFGDSVRLAIKVLDVETANVISGRSANIAKTKIIEDLVGKGVGRTGEVAKSTKPEVSPPAKPISVEVGGFRFTPAKCVRKGHAVRVAVSFLNLGENDASLSIIPGASHFVNRPKSILVDNDGRSCPANISIGGKDFDGSYTYPSYTFPPKTPVNVTFWSQDMSAEASSVTVSIGIRGFKKLVVIRNVPISN